MTTTLHRADYLDLEWFLHRDADLDPQALATRDRTIGQAAQAEAIPEDAYLPFWLNRLRAEHDQTLPSHAYLTSRALCAWILAALGFAGGMSLVHGLLQYSGSAPVNVSVFLAVAVFFQALLCLISAIMLAARTRHTTAAPRWSVVLSILRSLMRRLTRRALGTAPPAWIAQLTPHGRYGALFLLDAMALTQIMGTAFAAGSLLGTLIYVTTTDLAFGWQSTLSIGSSGLHYLVQAMALPWVWLPDSWNLIPTVEQIEGSRIILKDGIAHLQSIHLAAWWKFLTLSLLCYALLPRLALLAGVTTLLRRAEKSFSHPFQECLTLRMRTPRIQMPRRAEKPSAPLPEPRSSDSAQPWPSPTHPESGPCLILIPEELAAHFDTQARAHLLRELDCPQAETQLLPDNEDALRALRASWAAAPCRIALLIEAWQPPIQETRRTLAALLQTDLALYTEIVLIGRPQNDLWLTPPTHTELTVWRTALTTIPTTVRAFGNHP